MMEENRLAPKNEIRATAGDCRGKAESGRELLAAVSHFAHRRNYWGVDISAWACTRKAYRLIVRLAGRSFLAPSGPEQAQQK